jgi:hypothetical protein
MVNGAGARFYLHILNVVFVPVVDCCVFNRSSSFSELCTSL